MKKLLTILALVTSFSSIANDANSKIETYDDLVKKEAKARQEEIDSFENEAKEDREYKFVEVKDDAGYTSENESKERVRMDNEWNKSQDEFDKPWNNE